MPFGGNVQNIFAGGDFMNRPSWDEYFMEMAVLTSERSTCLRRKIGAVIVKDKHIIATGYNGSPRGLKHCDELGGCLRQKLGIPSGERHELCRALHAEQNAIIQAATLGQSIEGASIYITNHPCYICAKMIINAGIDRIVIKEGYPDQFAMDILKEAGKQVVMLRNEEETCDKESSPAIENGESSSCNCCYYSDMENVKEKNKLSDEEGVCNCNAGCECGHK